LRRWLDRLLLTGLVGLCACGSHPGTSGPPDNTKYQVQLSWTENNDADPAIGFNIYRNGPAGVEQLNSSPVTSTSYLDTSVISGQTYTYNVMSVDAAGVQSQPSNIITVAVP
jgi:fibronectin type 3 domain-containing protein